MGEEIDQMSGGTISVGMHAFARRFMPFLLKRCPGFAAGNLHWFWERECRCMIGTNGITKPLSWRDREAPK
jgi:hypothetical protein